ncbi:hypothetical protein SCHPADRAFT_902899 [Schizopora paradoxa]|uniref:SH3 domain-containing protein n=1 Tax=Schizopora paradoxa TaxID=27342 RepID=A0A0H2RSH3_9AGAM|nr:hypothetical protein SCHPADRAFT_902899 [Schizopora paradoxa]
MHDMLERRFSHQAQVQALKMRTEDKERRAAPVATTPTPTSKAIVTKTVVVKVPPTTTSAAKPVATTTSAAAAAKPTTTTSATSTSTTTSATSTSTTSTTSSTSTTSKAPATTNRNVVSATTPTTTSLKASSTVLSPTVDSSSSNAKASAGLSSGATGGIVAGVVLAVLVIVLFVIRKVYIRRRERKRNTWGAGLYPSYNDKDSSSGEHQALTANEPVPTPITSSSFGVTGAGYGAAPLPHTPDWQNDQMSSRAQMAPASTMATPSFYITPPPASYNNAVTEDAYGGLAPAAPTAAATETAIVNKTYQPTLGDELAVTVGEVVQVLRAFDDGWALCQNARGDKGVVPVQCMDWVQNANPRTGVQQGQSMYGQDVKGNGEWGNKRLSSLSGHGPRY